MNSAQTLKDEQVENAWNLYCHMDQLFKELKLLGRWSLFPSWLERVEDLAEVKRDYVDAAKAAGMDPGDLVALEEFRFRHTK